MLESIAHRIADNLTSQRDPNLVFICTHNSRRSQFAQVWAAVAAVHYGIRNVQCFSAGTEETSFNQNAIAALERIGFEIDKTEARNPLYTIRYAENAEPIFGFSKTLEHHSVPSQNFIAIMTCADADENCPIVHGAEIRFRLTYDDPKVSDNTPLEAETYDARCKQIATEILYLFSKVG